MGIFWKASVHCWRRNSKKPWLSLEPHGEDVRRFLRGEADFPCNMALTLTTLPTPVSLVSFHIPYATLDPDATFHFYVSGLNYMLWIPPNIPPMIAALSLHRPPHVLLEVDNSADITRKFRAAHAAQATARNARKQRN
jgi:hypothetical protein